MRLNPTDAAHENLRALHELWTGLLDGIIDDPGDIERVNEAASWEELLPSSTPKARKKKP